MQYEFLLLDLDNTLFDFSGAEKEALQRVLTEEGLPFYPQMIERYAAINDSCWKAFEEGRVEKSRLTVWRFELFLDFYGIKADAARINRLYMESLSRSPLLLAGAEEFLEKLQKKYKLYAVTNGTAFVQRRRIADSGISRYFEEIFISEELGVQKPHLLFFEMVAERIGGFSKEKALVIGDSLSSDVKGAENYGLDAMWFNPKGKQPDKGLTPRYTVSSYGEAEKILNV